VNNLELVKEGHTGHDLRELKFIDKQEKGRRETENRLTNCKRFASGLDTAYCITLPFGIHSVRMRKHWSADTETPNKGKTFGWDKCFQLMISLHNPWVKSEQW